MAGHSKWANIKHKKSAADAKKGKVFGKIGREMMVAARMGGGDPTGNPTLRALIQKARGVNMPADNIERAIKKGLGDVDGANYVEITYEGYAPGGVALIIECLTDNRNRTASEVRFVFSKYNGSMGSSGSVVHAFKRRGLIIVKSDAVDEEKLMETLIEAGADDFSDEGEVFEIMTEPAEFMAIVEALNAAGIPIENSEITMIPDNYIAVTDADQASSLVKFVDALDDLDDVQNVYHNYEIDEALMEQIGG